MSASNHISIVRSATRSRRLGQAAAGIAIMTFAVACGGSSDSDESSSTSSTSSPSGGLATTSASEGTILTDSAGRTLYGFAADTKGVSNCSGQCATLWPPVPVTGSIPKAPPGVTARLGELTRSDGTKQLTVDGLPVYTYVGDSTKGDTNGQGLNESGGLWWVVGTNGSWITDSAPAS